MGAAELTCRKKAEGRRAEARQPSFSFVFLHTFLFIRALSSEGPPARLANTIFLPENRNGKVLFQISSSINVESLNGCL